MLWEDVPEKVWEWSTALGPPGRAIRKRAVDARTLGRVGYYIDPETGRVGIHGEGATGTDLALCKSAAAGTDGVRPVSLSHQDLADPECRWVKVAYSPSVRRLGELLNFFPGQYPGGIPNAPSPVAAMLTSGVVGAGLGYGLGRIGGAVLPGGYGDGLGRTGAILGGLAGVMPGAAWAAANHASGRGVREAWPLASRPDATPAPEPGAAWLHGARSPSAEPGVSAVREYIRGLPAVDAFKVACEVLDGLEVPAAALRAAEKVAYEIGGTFGRAEDGPPATPIDVNIDAMGRTLWDCGASPQLAGATMGALFAAQQVPDPAARPGYATGNQLGTLAMNAAGDYVRGLAVGRALNAVIGTPYSPPAFGAGAAALGVIGSVIPRLFGG